MHVAFYLSGSGPVQNDIFKSMFGLIVVDKHCIHPYSHVTQADYRSHIAIHEIHGKPQLA